MKTPEEILQSKFIDLKREYKHPSEKYYIKESAEMAGGELFTKEQCLEAMNEYALQFIHPTKCWACDGIGKFEQLGNMTCQNCKGAGKVILLPTIMNTGT